MMKKKKCQKRRRKKSEDRISSLPDCLLVDIISRLPYTEDAFATGILSKRWKHVWTHVPNLIFHHDDVDDDPKRLRKFYSFVDNILSQRDQSNNLNRFILWSSYTQKIKSRVNNCILYAINHNVQEFDIDVWDHSRSTGPELPQAFFASSSFIHLRLSRCTFEQTCVISWSNLKSLYISHMELDESLIQNILSGSPLLETLELNECFGYRLLDINNKCVKNLVISGYREGRFIYSPEINVVEINAPYILSLSIQDSFVLEKLLLLNVSSVIEAELNYWEAIKDNRTYRDDILEWEKMCDEMNEEMLKGLLLSLGHVKEVKIRKWSLKALTGLKAKGFIYPSNLKVLGEIDSS